MIHNNSRSRNYAGNDFFCCGDGVPTDPLVSLKELWTFVRWALPSPVANCSSSSSSSSSSLSSSSSSSSSNGSSSSGGSGGEGTFATVAAVIENRESTSRYRRGMPLPRRLILSSRLYSDLQLLNNQRGLALLGEDYFEVPIECRPVVTDADFSKSKDAQEPFIKNRPMFTPDWRER